MTVEQFQEVVADVSKNVIFYGLGGTAAIWFLSRAWLLGARGAFWLQSLIFGLQALNMLWLSGLGMYLLLRGMRESRWSYYANGVRVVEAGLGMFLIWFTAGLVGYR